jgi:hypothetical protein
MLLEITANTTSDFKYDFVFIYYFLETGKVRHIFIPDDDSQIRDLIILQKLLYCYTNKNNV